MKIIKLDAAAWKSVRDFYAEILPALGAPSWHGTNVNALVESIVQGEINEMKPPFRIEITRSQHCPARVRQELTWMVEDTRSAIENFIRRRGYKPDVNFEVLS